MMSLLLNIYEQELEWLDMSLNVKKSTCIRTGPRFNANCCNIVTRDGRELAWTNVVRYLGIFFIESASCFKCSFDNAKRSFYRSFNGIIGRIGRIASNEVIVQLVNSKSFPVRFYGLEACSLRKYQYKSINYVINSTCKKNFQHQITGDCWCRAGPMLGNVWLSPGWADKWQVFEQI